jgi:hypothetical protein
LAANVFPRFCIVAEVALIVICMSIAVFAAFGGYARISIERSAAAPPSPVSDAW